MSIKFKAMTPSDYTEIGDEVKDSYSKDTFAVLSAGLSSKLIFGTKSNFNSTVKSAMRDNARAYISLARPVTNLFLTRKKARLLMKVLGQPAELGEKITSFRDVWSKSMNDFVDVDMITDINDMMCGAEILRMMIDEFDIEKGIEDAFGEIFTDKYAKPLIGTFNKIGEGYKLVGGYFFKPLSDGEVYEKFSNYIRSDYFTGPDTRISYLLNMSSKANLYGMIMDYVVVMPLGMRPDIDNRHDQFSQAYADIISANNNMKLVANGVFRPREYLARYQLLDLAVNRLIYLENPFKEKRKSIVNKLKGKEGFIRGKLLGKRCDYSGRSVITINPFLSIEKIGVPERMAPKLYRYHLLKGMSNPILGDVLGHENDAKMCERLKTTGILDRVPSVIGRQPTLHKLSMQAYKVLLTQARSIQLNPLCVSAFNADFDGDQMHIRTPNSNEAVREVRDLLLTTQNLFLPENGECTIMPRQEILYGLNICTLASYTKSIPVQSYSKLDDVVDDILKQKVKIQDTVICAGVTEVAGKAAFRWCISPYIDLAIEEITAKNIGVYVDALLKKGTNAFVTAVDKMVALGFKISKLYPPTLRLLEDFNTSNLFDEFHASMKEATRWYERGFEEEATYNLNFNAKYSALDENIKGGIIDRVGADNGFARLATSGARGSKGNLTQIYAYKGRIQRSARESFKAVIEHSYVDQLTPLEHFITAYGGRKGLIDKSLNTAKTGYTSRQMWHAAQSMTIKVDDCGTKNGLSIDKADIAMFASERATIDAIFIKIISGRYLASNGVYVTPEMAKQICSQSSSVLIRSPITCANPCCRKCYGDDLSTNRNAVVGLSIGFIAAHSIGKIGTQLSMDSFKKGGIASKGDVVSSFTKMEAYVNMHNIRNKASFSSYDPVAWATGNTLVTRDSATTQKVRIEGSLKSIKLPNEAMIKEYVEQGQGMCIERGDYDPRELLRYAGVEATQTYLIHMLYNIYRDECEVNMKHFETLVASMTMAVVLSTDRKDLKVGQFHDIPHLLSGPLDNTEYTKTIVGVNDVQLLRPMAMSSIIMEEIAEGLSRAILLESEDPLELPLQRVALGMRAKTGTHFPNYIENRRF